MQHQTMLPLLSISALMVQFPISASSSEAGGRDAGLCDASTGGAAGVQGAVVMRLSVHFPMHVYLHK
jgi:hypothetical protein